MPIDQAVFLRIDTASGCPGLEGACGETVVSALLNAREKGWFDLLGFVVLPREVQLLIVPRAKSAGEVLGSLEAALDKQLDGAKTVFDTDYYREKVDCDEEVRQRLKWMHLAPVRSRLTMKVDAYPYSSANSRYRSVLPLTQTLM